MKFSIFNFQFSIKDKNSNRGFVILFAVTISSILLAIALGVANIAYKEVKFSTSGKETNDAFFAADTGAECALQHDKSIASQNAFTGTSAMNCVGVNVAVTLVSTDNWSFTLNSLGASGTACAKVTVSKSPTTTVISKGYNIANCASATANKVERELKVTY